MFNRIRYDMRHEMLTQCAPFCIGAMAKNGTLSQHFVTHVVPPLVLAGVHNAKAEECTTPYMRQNIKINIGVGGLHGNQGY